MGKEQLRQGPEDLGQHMNKGDARDDMRLPAWILGLGTVLCLGGGALLVLALVGVLSAPGALCGAGLLLLGVAAVLCFKNQRIRLLSKDEFEYRTFLGNTRRYRASDITCLKRNADSWTLEVAGDKVHIESVAILSPRLTEMINRRMDEIERGA